MIEHPSLETATSGSIRFNTDSSKLEIYNGEAWFEIDATSPYLHTGGTRALFGGGYRPSPGPSGRSDEIDFVNVDSTGSASDFGDISGNIRGVGALASRTRGVFTGGYAPGYINTMSFVTISSTGNVSDFGDLTIPMYHPTTAASSTRGVITSGESDSPLGTNNVMCYITIAQTGNAVDFGDLYDAQRNGAGFASPTRGIVAGGYGAPTNVNIIQYFTISTLGNSADFGDLSSISTGGSGASSNAVRGLIPLGQTPSNPNDASNVEFITIATLGNATDFGDLTVGRRSSAGGSSRTRAVIAGGMTPNSSDVIDYAQIMTTGNFIDFGDLNGDARAQFGGCSNGHGGLG